MAKEANQSQMQLVREYFMANPKRHIRQSEVSQWLMREYQTRTGLPFLDPWRAVRKLAEEGWLLKVARGVYMYDPDHIQQIMLEDFTEAQKQAILARDDYRCVICGRGNADGVDLHVDHIIPKSKGGKGTLENGQTLCAQHNLLKKNYNQSESGKRFFIRLYQQAKAIDDEKIVEFCRDILAVYAKHDINGHIEWRE